MKTKKTSLVLAALMATCVLTNGVLAAEADIDEPAVAVDTMAEATHVTYSGVVAETAEDEVAGQYILFGEDERADLRLNVTEETVIIHADGMPASFEDIEKGAAVVAYHGLASTFSLPPQSAAEVIVLMEEETTAAPIYATIGSVTETEEGILLESKDGSYVFTIVEDAEITPYKTRNIVTAADLTEGKRILAWSEVMTLSLPAQVTPDKVMLLPEAVAVEDEADKEEEITGLVVNGKAFAAEIKIEDGVELLPIRVISEHLGYTVTWNGEERSVLVADDENALTVVLGNKNVSGKERSEMTLSKEPVLLDGSTYVTPDFFALLTGDETIVEIRG